MSFEAGLAAFKQNKFGVAIEQLHLYCQKCDAAGKVTSQKYMQAHIGLVKSYQKLGQLEQSIAHCQGLADTQNPALKIWVDKMLPKFVAAAEKAKARSEEGETEAESAVAATPTPSQPNEMLLQQGIQSYKNMKYDRAIALLKDYLTDCTNDNSRNYMQAQMALVKAHRAAKQISEAIAHCEKLSTSENFAIKSWAAKALPKLQKELGPSDKPASEASVNTTSTTRPAPSSTPTSPATSRASKSTHPASVKQSASVSSTTRHQVSSQTAAQHQSSHHTAAFSTTTSKSGTLKQIAPSSYIFDALPHYPSHSPNPSSKSTPLQSTSPFPKPSMLFSWFSGKRAIWKTMALVVGLMVFVIRSCSGIFTPEISFTSSTAEEAALQNAVIIGDRTTVERLISEGISLETTDGAGNTLIFSALGVNNDCDINWVCQMNPNQQEIVHLLLNHGANVTVTNNWQETPLHVAAKIGGTADILGQMIDQGASVQTVDFNQASPLHRAAEYGATDNIELLLNREADVNAKDITGRTPLDYATPDSPAAQIIVSRGGTSGF